MTTPTQAQIEAARDSAKSMIDYLAKAALTAAAEVGKQSETPTVDGIIHHLITSDTNATIERCAQVADNFYDRAGVDIGGRSIAAAIRALKDNK